MSTTMVHAAISPTANLSKDEKSSTKRASIPHLLVLHLLPGLVIVVGYALLAWLMRSQDLPALLTFILTIPLTLIPMELGYLLYQGKRKNGYFTLRGVIAYNQPLSFTQYAIWIPVTLFASIMLFVLFGAVDTILYQQLFFWWPAWMNPDLISLHELSPRMLWITVDLLMVLGNWIGPFVEELYFRGYLLPQMAHLGRWGVVLNGALFALYHFWSPWHVIGRAIGILPLGFAARNKRNVVIPIVVHCTLNTVGTLLAVAAIL